MLTGHRESF